MWISLSQQALAFAYAILLGVAFGVVYDVFRIIRLMFFKSSAVVFVEDILFWLICTVATFAFTVLLNNGELRLFLILAEVLGFILYYFTIGRLVFKASNAIVGFLKRIFGGIFSFFKRIFSKVHKIFKKIFKKACKNAKKPLQSGERV